MGIERYYTTAGSNTDVDGINIAEGMAPNLVNNAMRQMVTNVRKWFNDAEWVQYGSGDGPPDISYVSATSFTVNGVDVTDEYHAGRRVKAVGSSTGTIYGTIQSSDFVTNTTVTVDWDSGQLENEALEIYLAILRAENVSLPNSDAARATLGLGSMATQDADSVAITGGSATFTGSLSMESTSAGAAEGPVPELYRNRSSPSNNEDLGAIHFTGNDSGGNKHTFAAVEAAAETVTNGAEDGIIRLQTSRGGSVLGARLFVGAGVWTQGATGGDPGAGKINAQEYQINGANIFPVGASNLASTGNERTWILGLIAGASAGSVGMHGFMKTQSGTVDAGQTTAGSNLRYSNADNGTGVNVPSGTWRALGRANPAGTATLFMRIS